MSAKGFSKHFLGSHAVIEPPELHPKEKIKFRNKGLDQTTYWLDYTHYSVFQNPFRMFPYYSVSNIDGKHYHDIRRAELFNGKGDRWVKDKRIPRGHQLGNELYSADYSDFDKGHLTKRQDTQWGGDRSEAIHGAESTFYYTNAMPQADRLNRGVWRRIEDYILHQEVVQHSMKIVVFTGPIFTDTDPKFVTTVKGKTIYLPCVFWKVIYYLRDGILHRTGFMTRQRALFEQKRIIKPSVRGDSEPEEFMAFKDAETYQVRVDYIEKQGGLVFTPSAENYTDPRPEELIMSRIEVRSSLRAAHLPAIKNLTI